MFEIIKQSEINDAIIEACHELSGETKAVTVDNIYKYKNIFGYMFDFLREE